MRAITVLPRQPNSAQLDDVPEPAPEDGALLVRAIALGVCGTDREIVSGAYGDAPEGHSRLILGHESFGEVIEAPAESGFAPGDHVVGIVRRPDPVPCAACGAGEWDMCRNGLYTERGIKQRNGYGSERFRLEPDFAVKVDRALGIHGVLIEPTSVVAKAWDHLERVGRRSHSWTARTLLVTGAGPVGFLGALMGQQRGLEVHILDHHRDGPKPLLAAGLGARYYASIEELGDLQADIVLECTGVAQVIIDIMTKHVGASGMVCLLGLSASKKVIEADIAAFNQITVLQNHALLGSVNANRRHYEMAAEALAKADRGWLDKLISRRVPLARWQEALENRPGDIKVVIDFAA